MGMIDRIFGRKVELEAGPVSAGVSTADTRAVDGYQRMLRAAPPGVIERAHVEAFERLTPTQLDLLFERLTADAEQDDERPVDAKPANLARSAARAGRRRPDATERSFRLMPAGADMSAWVWASMLDAIAWYAIASVAWTSWSVPGEGTSDIADATDTADGGEIWDLGL